MKAIITSLAIIRCPIPAPGINKLDSPDESLPGSPIPVPGHSSAAEHKKQHNTATQQ